MTALKTEDFGCTADVSVVLVKLFQNIVAFVSCARLVQGGGAIDEGKQALGGRGTWTRAGGAV